MCRFVFKGSGPAVVVFLAIASLGPLAGPAAAQQASPQTTSRDVEARLDLALREIHDLRTQVTAQTSRITNLEKTVRALQDRLTTPASNRWRTAEGWAEIRIGMSRAEVESILGPPRTADSVIDKLTLTYGTANGVVGTVVLVDDRVANVDARGFKITLP
jgi:hypothetical protein